MDCERPTCDFQSPWLILSRISASRVALSGMRSKASARHISATPSWLERENSCTSAATPLPTGASRRPCTSLAARAWTLSACSASLTRARGSRAGRHSVSGRCQAAVMAARSGVCGKMDWAKCKKGCTSWGAWALSSLSSASAAALSVPTMRMLGRPRSSASTYCTTACLSSQCGVRPKFWAAARMRSRSASSTLIPRVVDIANNL